MIEIRLTRTLGDFRLDLDARSSGPILGLFGPSGSGKTTVLNCLAGAVHPDAGLVRLGSTILLDHDAGVSLPIRRRRIGYVFQDSLLFDHLTVRRNILYGYRNAGGGPTPREVIDVLALADLLDRRPRELSGGQQRRVALARALLANPALLLLDEPLTGLDAPLAGRVLVFLKRVFDAFRIPAVYVSHSISDIIYLCDDLLVMKDGRLLSQGPPAAVIAHHGVLDETHLSELRNVFIAGQVHRDEQAGALRCRIGPDQSLLVYHRADVAAERLTLSIRACDIILSAEPPRGISARNVLPAVVQRIAEVDHKVLVFIDVGTSWMVEVGPAAVQELELAPGRRVWAILKATGIDVL